MTHRYSLGLVTFRYAVSSDCPLLAELNHQLIRDEGHRNRMSVRQLEKRIRAWISAKYRAVIFENDTEVVGYALFKEKRNEVYLRQLFISRGMRRKGYGREALRLLREEIWPTGKRLTVEVLVNNKPAVRFWRAVGYRDYSLMLEIMPGERIRPGRGAERDSRGGRSTQARNKNELPA